MPATAADIALLSKETSSESSCYLPTLNELNELNELNATESATESATEPAVAATEPTTEATGCLVVQDPHGNDVWMF